MVENVWPGRIAREGTAYSSRSRNPGDGDQWAGAPLKEFRQALHGYIAVSEEGRLFIHQHRTNGGEEMILEILPNGEIEATFDLNREASVLSVSPRAQ